MKTGPSRLLVNLGVSAATIGLTLLAAELALRALGYAPEAHRHTERIANGHRTLLLDCYPTNPRGYFEIDLRSRETRARYRGQGVARVDEVAEQTPFAVERRYNSMRFRGPEIGPKPPDRVRVVVIGDSFTEGMGVKEQDTYPRVLERLLSRDRPRPEVLNCGRRGWDFPDLYDTFVEIQELEPEIVIYGMVLNDAERSESFSARQSYLNDWILVRGRMFREQRPRLGLLDSRLAAVVEDRLERSRVARETTSWYRDMYGDPNRDGWADTQRYLQRMNTAMRERGGHLLIAAWPLLVGFEAGYPFQDVSETIARFCLSAGIPRHDLLPALQGHRTETLWVHPVDHHPNELAHRLAAESLAPVVRLLLEE
jgi:lysophospholipase L1-like esterase